MNNEIIVMCIIAAGCLAGAIGIKLGRWAFQRSTKKSKENYNFKILFHTDAHPIGTHGSIYVDCPSRNWKGEPIKFVLLGVPAAPTLNPDLMKKIWEEAELVGFIPLGLRSYIGVYGEIKPPRATVPVHPTPTTFNTQNQQADEVALVKQSA